MPHTNPHPSRRRIPASLSSLVVLCVLLGAGSASAASAAVGSFAKSTSTGTQRVTHTLGAKPSALLLWTEVHAADGVGNNVTYAVGITDGTHSFTTTVASANGANPTKTAKAQRAKALSIMSSTLGVVAEADFSASDSSSFTLNWTSNDANADQVHFIVFGGTARALTWTVPGAVGDAVVSGVGFSPDVLLHFYVSGDTGALPINSGNLHFCLGVTNSALQQWTLESFAETGVSPSSTSHSSRSTAAINVNEGTLVRGATLSMNADGFTTRFSNVNAGSGTVLTLALKGFSSAAAVFARSTSGGTQAITGLSFKPDFVLFSGNGTLKDTAGSNGAFGMGAYDGTRSAATAYFDVDNQGSAAAFDVERGLSSYVELQSNRSVAAEATVSQFNADGFSLNWSTANATAASVFYLALGTPAADAGTGTGTAAGLDAGTDSGGSTGGGSNGDPTSNPPQTPLDDGGIAADPGAPGSGSADLLGANIRANNGCSVADSSMPAMLVLLALGLARNVRRWR